MNRMQRDNIAKCIRRKYSVAHFAPALYEFDVGNTISFEIKVFIGKINRTTLVMYSIKITAHSGFR